MVGAAVDRCLLAQTQDVSIHFEAVSLVKGNRIVAVCHASVRIGATVPADQTQAKRPTKQEVVRT